MKQYFSKIIYLILLIGQSSYLNSYNDDYSKDLENHYNSGQKYFDIDNSKQYERSSYYTNGKEGHFSHGFPLNKLNNINDIRKLSLTRGMPFRIYEFKKSYSLHVTDLTRRYPGYASPFNKTGYYCEYHAATPNNDSLFMGGSRSSNDPTPYKIAQKGLFFYPNKSFFDSTFQAAPENYELKTLWMTWSTPFDLNDQGTERIHTLFIDKKMTTNKLIKRGVPPFIFTTNTEVPDIEPILDLKRLLEILAANNKKKKITIENAMYGNAQKYSDSKNVKDSLQKYANNGKICIPENMSDFFGNTSFSGEKYLFIEFSIGERRYRIHIPENTFIDESYRDFIEVGSTSSSQQTATNSEQTIEKMDDLLNTLKQNKKQPFTIKEVKYRSSGRTLEVKGSALTELKKHAKSKKRLPVFTTRTKLKQFLMNHGAMSSTTMSPDKLEIKCLMGGQGYKIKFNLQSEIKFEKSFNKYIKKNPNTKPPKDSVTEPPKDSSSPISNNPNAEAIQNAGSIQNAEALQSIISNYFNN